MNIKDYIRTVPDYPIEGVNFYDINSLFASNLWTSLVEDIAKRIQESIEFMPTHIVGIESRGFVLGAALSQELDIPFVMIRKKGTAWVFPSENVTNECSIPISSFSYIILTFSLLMSSLIAHAITSFFDRTLPDACIVNL